MALHASLDYTENHVAHAYEYANETQRTTASGFTDADVGKLALQTDDSSLWMCISQTGGTPSWLAAIKTGTIVTDTIEEETLNNGVSIDPSSGSFVVKDGGCVASATIAATAFTGDLTGDVTGDLTGDVTGTVNTYVPLYTDDAAAQTFDGQKNFSVATLSDGASIAWDLDTEASAKVTLGGNRTLANPTNMVDGGTYILRVHQDVAGSRTLAFGANYKFPNGVDPVLTTTASGWDILTFTSDGTYMIGVHSGPYVA